GIDAWTVIAHFGNALRAAADLQLDALSLRRMLDGVAHQVVERAAQPEGIAAHSRRSARPQLHPDPPRRGREPLRIYDLAGDGAEVHRLVLRLDAAGFQARERQQILGELLQLVGALPDPQREAARGLRLVGGTL